MSVTANNSINSYIYTYQNKVQPKIDKDDDAAWSKDELTNYASAYNKATGKTLDVDKLMEKYADENGMINSKAQAQMRADDALGLSVLENATSTSTSGSGTSSTTTSTAQQPAMAQSQKDAIHSAVNTFTYDYHNKLMPTLDKDDDGLWSKEEITNYANAYEKATGNSLDVDAIMKQYGNDDGYIDPKNQAIMTKNDALDLSGLKSTLDSIPKTSYYAPNPVTGNVTSDSTSSSKSSSSLSMQDLLENMSSSGKMFFSTKIQGYESQQALLNNFSSFGSSSFGSMFALANAKTDALNTYRLSMAQGGSAESLYSSMSGNMMNFSI